LNGIYASDDPKIRSERGKLLFIEPEDHLLKRTKKYAHIYHGMDLIPVMIYEKGISVEQIKRRDDVGAGEVFIREFIPRISDLVKGEKELYEITYRFIPYSKITKVSRVRTLTLNVYAFSSTEGRFAVDATIPGIKQYMEWIKTSLEMRKLEKLKNDLDKL
jgi:hypothetical protein